MQYDCAVCLKPLNPDDAGTIPAVGVTEDGTDSWVWGPYPVHDSRCQDRLAHPRLQQLLETDGHTRSSIWLDLSDPHTEAVLAHCQSLMASPFIDRRAVQHWSDSLSGPEGLEAQTPWPDMDAVAHLAAGRLTCLGTRSRSREAQAGYDPEMSGRPWTKSDRRARTRWWCAQPSLASAGPTEASGGRLVPRRVLEPTVDVGQISGLVLEGGVEGSAGRTTPRRVDT